MVDTVLRERRSETPFAATLRFDLRGAPFPYRPGQYLTIDVHQFPELGAEVRAREEQRGKPLGPAYFSIASDGMERDVVEITVKLPRSGPPPFVADHLIRALKPGTAVALGDAAGKYGLPESPPEGVTGFLHLCAGSGVVPNRGMIRSALARDWPQRHLLLVQDQSEADALYRAEWVRLASDHVDLFKTVPLFSQERGERITADAVLRAAQDRLDLSSSWAFLCGPAQARADGPGFVDRMRSLLLSLCFDPSRIRSE